jgi:inosine/xanthosine triphosphatase
MKVIVASKNPVKINAARQAFESMFSEGFTFEGVSVDSGVSDQPFGSTETYQGALNRAEAASRVCPDADFWIGIEGGIEKVGDKMHCMAWVVVKSGKQIGASQVASFQLPKCVQVLIEEGMELGDAAARHFNEPNSKQRMGVVGILTYGQIDRTAYYVPATKLALVPFKNSELYLRD